MTIAPARIPASLPEGNADRELSPEAAFELQKLRNTLSKRSADHLGYPYNFDHAQHLGPLHDLLRFSINNLGDPFDPSNYEVQSRQFETQVIDIYAQLWGAAAGEYWGYVAHSGTEGNRLCIDIAGRMYPDATMYCSEATHYSVPGAAKSFRLVTQCITTQPSGEVDYFVLASQLARSKAEAKQRGDAVAPKAIIVLNIGTTMTGAVDDVDTVLSILTTLGYDLESEVFIHLDGALSGLMVPFIDFAATAPATCVTAAAIAFRAMVDAAAFGDMSPEEVEWKRAALAALPAPRAQGRSHPDFRHKAVASYSCSGHKFLGCPMPAGIVVVRGKFVEAVHETVEYLGNSKLVTSMGSRNGHSPVFLWHELQRKGSGGLRADVELCLDTAAYLKQLLTAAKIGCFLNPCANTVVFERPCHRQFELKWHLACQGAVAHVVVMPSVGRAKLQEFVEAYTALKKGTWVAPVLPDGTPPPPPATEGRHAHNIAGERVTACMKQACGPTANCFCADCQ
jgi:histidine decarboxylase